MAWFRRKRDEHDESPATSGDTAASAPSSSDGGDVIRAEKAHAGDWMAVPPLHTTVGPPPTTFLVQRLPEILTTRRPMVFTGQLGHQVSSSAPSGTVDGLTSAVRPPAASTGHVDLPLVAHIPGTQPVHASHHAGPEPDGDGSRATPPFVQRELAVASSAPPAATITPSFRASAPLPEPTPTRVLREPSRAAAIGDDRPAPPVHVVDDNLATAPAASSETAPAEGFIAPDQPVEFTFGPGLPPQAGAPLVGDVAIQRTADLAIDDDGDEESADAARSVDLPLAGGASPAPMAGASAPAADIMPPIQPRAIQRRAAQSAVHRAPTAPANDDLPPLPDWAPPAFTAHDAEMPLHSNVPLPRGAADGTARAEEGATAPLLGQVPLGDTPDGVAVGNEHEPASARADLPLHASAGTTAVQRQADDHAHEEPGDDGEDDADDVEPGGVAPLLGDRPLQLQGAAETTALTSAHDASPTPRPIDLPLAPDAANGPSLGNAPTTPDARSDDATGSLHEAAAPSRGTGTAGDRALLASPASALLQRSTVDRDPGRTTSTPMSTPASSAPGPTLPLRTLPATATTATAPSASARAADSPLHAGAPLAVQTMGEGAPRTNATPLPTAPSMPLQEPARPRADDHPAGLGDLAVAAGVGQRTADGSVVFSTPSFNGAAYADGTTMSLQRDANGAVSASSAPPVPSTMYAEIVAQRETEAPPAPGATADSADDDKRTDELAAKVYERIRWKLAAEMRADARRVGAAHWNRKGR